MTALDPAGEALRRAAELVPVLRERAARTEQLRRLPPETVKDLISAGLVRIGAPRRYGGNGLDIDAGHAVAWELGRACGSAAWCCSLWIVHNWWLGHFPERAQDDFFASGPDTLASTCLNPAGGAAEPAPSGFRVSGRWSFSSGCEASAWAMVSTPGPTAGTIRWLLLPRGDYEIVDTWFASGMRGTGSHDIVVRGAFVPAHRALDPDRAGDTDRTGWQLHRRPSYRVPLRLLTGWDLAAPLVGVAQGAVDEFVARLRGTAGPGRTADSVPLQLRLAEASAQVDAARAIHRRTVGDMLERAAAGGSFTELDRRAFGATRPSSPACACRRSIGSSRRAAPTRCWTPIRCSASTATPTPPPTTPPSAGTPPPRRTAAKHCVRPHRDNTSAPSPDAPLLERRR